MIDRILSVDHAFGQLELYVFGQDWPKAIRSTGNSVDKGPTAFATTLNASVYDAAESS